LIRKQTLKEGNEDLLREMAAPSLTTTLSRSLGQSLLYGHFTIGHSSNTRFKKAAVIIGCPFSGLILRGRIHGRYSSRRDKFAARGWKEASNTRREAAAPERA
jgi:hypothetical protein